MHKTRISENGSHSLNKLETFRICDNFPPHGSVPTRPGGERQFTPEYDMKKILTGKDIDRELAWTTNIIMIGYYPADIHSFLRGIGVI